MKQTKEQTKDAHIDFENTNSDSIFRQVLGTDSQYIDIKNAREYNFLPDLMMHIGSFTVKKDFVRFTATENGIKDSISFHFYHSVKNNQGRNEIPYVRIFPVSLSQKIPMTKGMQVAQLSVSISAAYLKNLLKEASLSFQYLLDSSHTFLMEEVMSDDILSTVTAIVSKDQPAILKSFYYKLSAMQLLFYLFQSLHKRDRPHYQKLSEGDIDAIYKVRDTIISTLDKPPLIPELKMVAAMNEFKMRKIFNQIFGMGIYEYFQHFRMKQAARLLREDRLQVSQVGYQLGFQNMSHFSRVFEKHIGQKPKKYSQHD